MNEEKTIKNFFKNCDVLKWVIIGLVGFVVLIFIFGAGVKVGTTKARHSYRWAENYHRNFGGPRGGFLGGLKDFPQGEFINAHGVFGSIIKIEGNTIIAKAKDDVEKTVIVSDGTIIKEGRERVKLSDLKVGEEVVIIGSPNKEGQIEAKLIRVFDGSDQRGLPFRPSRRAPFN